MPLSRIDLAQKGPASDVESSSQVTHRSTQPVNRGALRIVLPLFTAHEQSEPWNHPR